MGVVGAGTMGNGIAHVFARSGFQVVLCEVEQRFLDRGLEAIRKNMEREAAKGKVTAAEAETALGLIRGTLQGQDLAVCDFVIEAAPERFALKQELFMELDAVLKPEVILASNTSSISITRLAAQTQRPGQVIGMHFFNPVPVMKLVEVIRGLETTDETFARVKALAETLGKSPVEVQDAPGFVSNRVLDATAQRGHVRGHGRGSHARRRGPGLPAGHGPPHGAAGAGRLYRTRCLSGHHAGDGRRPGRPQVPALPAAHSHGGCGLAGAEVGARILPVLRPAMAQI